MSPRPTLVLATASALLLAAYFAVAWPRRLAALGAEAYGGRLRTLQALDFRLTGELMKARSGLVGHYDGLVQTELELDAIHHELERPPAFLSPAQRSELLRRLSAADQVRVEARATIERWKSANAVLRNSLHFLPMAAVALDGKASALPEQQAVREAADLLVRDVLLLQYMEDAALLQRISRQLDTLSVASVPPPLATELRLVLTHARIVRDRTPTVNALTRAIVRMPMAARSDALISAYTRYLRMATDRANDDTRVLFALALVAVCAAAAAIILRARRSAHALRLTTQQLEQALASLRLEQAKDRELSELKTRFVSMTSHEFRTPLSTIMSSSEMLAAYRDKWPAEKSDTHFARIKEAVLGMTRMLDSILLIGRSDAGMLTFEPRPMDVARLCAEAVDAASSADRERRVVLSGPEPGEIVLGDESLLRHILQNLLSNALKYSAPREEVRLHVSREQQDLLFEVQDHGIGIPEEDQARLFETFHRGKNVGRVAGSGLGLAIVKRAVDLHGGVLHLESQVGVGTKLCARLPCPRS